MSKTKLLPCPFCGGQGVQRDIICYTNPATQVYCLNCKAETSVFPTGFDPILERNTTLEDARARAIKLWNTRRAAI